MLVLLLLAVVSVVLALAVWVGLSGHSGALGPMLVLLAAAVPAAYGIWYAARNRGRSKGAMAMVYALLAAAMLWAYLRT